MPVFTRLSEHDLLVRCLNGFTQNQNESFNALIWKRCPKHLWRGPAQIEVGLNLAVLTWHSGCSKTRRDCLQGLRLTHGKHSADASNAKDLKRVKVSSERFSECEKKKRAAPTKQKLCAEEIKKQKEGQTYGRAAFAGLQVPADHWESDNDIPLANNWDSDDDIPLALI